MIRTRWVTRPGIVRGTRRCSKSCIASNFGFCSGASLVKTSVLPVQARESTSGGFLPNACEKWHQCGGMGVHVGLPSLRGVQAGACLCAEAPIVGSSMQHWPAGRHR